MQAYEYQIQAERVLRDTEKNLLVIAPTGAGKTESGFTGLEIAGKGIYLAPTRALCYEKAQWLRQRFPGLRVVLGNKDYSLTLGDFHGSHIRVLTPWKFGVILHNDPNFAHHCNLVVVDEVRKLDPEVELVITKLKQLHPGVRLVGLSANLHEEDEAKLASWMDAVVVKSEQRPVPLIARVAHFDPDFTEEGEEYVHASFWEGANDFDHRRYEGSMSWIDRVVAVVDYIRESDNAPILIYTPYRERARQLAENLAESCAASDELQEAANSLPPEAGDFTDTLKSCLPKGVGLHHGGLTVQERELVFQLALEGKLSIVVTCQTLATGINLPARHLIVESVYCEPDGSDEKRLMSCSDFWDIGGRAGRPQFDSIGYVWIPVATEIERAEVEEVLLKNKASTIVSRVYNEYFLTSHVAGLIQLGYSTPQKLVEFMRATYYGATLQDQEPLVAQFEKIIARLVQEGFVKQMGKFLVLTDRGQRLARLGFHPAEYKAIETLIERESAYYDAWVEGLLKACGEYVLKNREPTEEEIEQVIALGMTAHSIKSSWHVRELVDYVSRLLELTFNFLEFNKVEESYRRAYKCEVADRFLFGQIKIARKLARVLPRTAVKRVLRNFGPLEKVDEETGESAPIVLDDTGLMMLARVIWSQHGMPSDGELGRVAGVFGVTEVRFRRIVRDALAEKQEEAA